MGGFPVAPTCQSEPGSHTGQDCSTMKSEDEDVSECFVDMCLCSVPFRAPSIKFSKAARLPCLSFKVTWRSLPPDWFVPSMPEQWLLYPLHRDLTSGNTVKV